MILFLTVVVFALCVPALAGVSVGILVLGAILLFAFVILLPRSNARCNEQQASLLSRGFSRPPPALAVLA
jgi:hypothetical protein